MFGTTKTLFLAMGCMLVGTMFSPASAAAQKSQTVTGCLAKGSAEGSFEITDADGHEHMLSSTKVKLQDHVGHKVTVKGMASGMGMMKDKGMAMAQDTGMAMAKDTGMAMAKDTGMAMAKHGGMAGESMMEVTSLKMVSPSCK